MDRSAAAWKLFTPCRQKVGGWVGGTEGRWVGGWVGGSEGVWVRGWVGGYLRGGACQTVCS